MALTPLQESAVKLWADGRNVRVCAVPGAGKSRVLIEACAIADGICLILAYNRELCDETKAHLEERGMQDWVACMTFHGLASYCASRCISDDVSLLELVDELDGGRATLSKCLDRVDKILIDECQDFRPSFLRLIAHSVPPRPETQYMVVGDERQMLYDYFDDDPADLRYLRAPEQHFCSARQWETVLLDETHRMTPEIAEIVERTFQTTIRSARPRGVPVEVHTINMWRAGPLVWHLLRGEPRSECCVLVPRKQNNGPLRAAVNYLSQRGTPIWIHGLDGQDARIKRNKLGFSSWHASKGTQKRVCVVLGLAGGCLRNACFVAATRGMDRLILIQDEANPYLPLVQALAAANPCSFTADKATRDLLTRSVAEAPPPCCTSPGAVCLDAWRPSGSGRWICALSRVTRSGAATHEESAEAEAEVTQQGGGATEDVSEVYRIALLMMLEREHTGRVRRVAEIRNPPRVSREDQPAAIRAGSHSRFVSPTIPEKFLLDPAAKARLVAAFDSPALSAAEWCFAACAVRAWNGYHHILRQLQPYGWFDEAKLDRAARFARHVLAGCTRVEFDVRVARTVGDAAFHLRCDVTSAERNGLFVWQGTIAPAHRMQASIAACMHASRECFVADLRSETVETISVEEGDAEKILAKLAAERRATQAPTKKVCGSG